MRDWRESLILRTSVRIVFPVAIVLSLFLLFAGHNAPGGGFIAGLVAGAALVMRPPGDLDRVIPIPPPVVLGTGLVISTATAIAGLLNGGELLESSKFERDLPVLGVVKATSALPFDIGVFLVVIGLVLTAQRFLGEEERR
jgi:multicomponent Na+:H+ antiporter subunit A